MMQRGRRIDPELELPLTFLRRYIFYLHRRPVSVSNSHFRSRRIHALKSLVTLFENRGDPALDRISATLRALTEANLLSLAALIERELRSMVPLPFHRDVVISSAAPLPGFLRENSRALVAFGPAIGIGDEIICFPVPAWLKQLGCEVTVLTAYPELWDSLMKPQEIRAYNSSRQFIDQLRGIPSPSDLTLVIDFESPGLSAAVSREIGTLKYAEISLGIGSVTALDRHYSRLHRMPPFDPYFPNVYHRLDHMTSWLGISRRERSHLASMKKSSGRANDEMTILVSPFTSKFEPSQAYWGDLLNAVLLWDDEVRFRIQIDTGPNQFTEAFALDLAKIVRANAPAGAHIELVEAARRCASIKEIFDCLQGADIVLAADSYLAHAAPAFGIPALIVARDGVENWRVPDASNFYFRAMDSIPAVASAMRIIISELSSPLQRSSRRSPRDRSECRRLQTASAQVAHLLATTEPDLREVRELWNECHQAYWRVANGLASWPASFKALLADKSYEYLLSPCPEFFDESPNSLNQDSLLHLRNQHQDWRNSNLQKYLTGFDGRHAN